MKHRDDGGIVARIVGRLCGKDSNLGGLQPLPPQAPSRERLCHIST